MKFLLDDLNLKSYDEVKLAFLGVPKTVDEVTISHHFEKPVFSYSNVYQNLHYFPEHVHTIRFEYLSDVITTSPELIGIEKLGDNLINFVAALPSWVHTLKLAFSIVRHPNSTFSGNLPAVSDGFLNVFANIPSHVHHLDLSGCSMSLSSLELSKIMSAIPPHIQEFDLGKFKIGAYSLSDRMTVLQAIPKTVQKLGFSFNDFYHNTAISNLIRIFSGIHPKITSLSLANNKLGSQRDSLHFRALLASITTSFPILKELDLRSNRFDYYIHKNCFDECLKVLPPSLSTVLLGDIGLLFAGRAKMAESFKQFPRLISTMDIADIINNDMPELDLLLTPIPRQISVLQFKNIPWLGLDANNFSRILGTVPEHVHTLDLSRNSFHNKPVKDSIQVLKAIPNHITHLILRQNFLSSMSLTNFSALMNAIPKTVRFLDLEDNGLEYLAHSQMNQYLDSISDLEIGLDFRRVAIHPKGYLVSNMQAQDYLIRPKRLLHQKQTSEILIGLSQISRSKKLSLANLELIASYAISDYKRSKTLINNQLHRMFSQNFFLRESCLNFNDSVAMRISLSSLTHSPRLDFSLMGMFLLNDVKLMSGVFKRIPNHVKYVNLSYNRRTDLQETRECVFQAFKEFPQTVQVVDLRGNSFEKLPELLLKMWLSSMPSHIKIIISEEIPVTFSQYVLRMAIPDFYRTMTHEHPKFLDKASILLDDYTQGDSVLRRFFNGYWNRNHIQQVDKMVWKIRKNLIGNIRDVIQEFSAMSLKNDTGSLAKIIMYLICELEKMETPQESPIQTMQIC